MSVGSGLQSAEGLAPAAARALPYGSTCSWALCAALLYLWLIAVLAVPGGFCTDSQDLDDASVSSAMEPGEEELTSPASGRGAAVASTTRRRGLPTPPATPGTARGGKVLPLDSSEQSCTAVAGNVQPSHLQQRFPHPTSCPRHRMCGPWGQALPSLASQICMTHAASPGSAGMTSSGHHLMKTRRGAFNAALPAELAPLLSRSIFVPGAPFRLTGSCPKLRQQVQLCCKAVAPSSGSKTIFAETQLP